MCSGIINGCCFLLPRIINGYQRLLSRVINGYQRLLSRIINGYQRLLSRIINGYQRLLSRVINGYQRLLSSLLKQLQRLSSCLWTCCLSRFARLVAVCRRPLFLLYSACGWCPWPMCPDINQHETRHKAAYQTPQSRLFNEIKAAI